MREGGSGGLLSVQREAVQTGRTAHYSVVLLSLWSGSWEGGGWRVVLSTAVIGDERQTSGLYCLPWPGLLQSHFTPQ